MNEQSIEPDPSQTGESRQSSQARRPSGNAGQLFETPSIDETTAALCLNLTPGVGPRIYADLIEKFGSASNVLAAAPADLRNVSGVGSKLVSAIINAPETVNVGQQISICKDNNIEILDRDSEKYPVPLSEIYDPPSILFSQGSLLPADNLAIAIVGSRHATNYGIKTASRLARGLAMAGFTIVSGLARGIDAAAHHGALEAGGRTLAVLGGGHLRLYPPEHAELANESPVKERY